MVLLRNGSTRRAWGSVLGHWGHITEILGLQALLFPLFVPGHRTGLLYHALLTHWTTPGRKQQGLVTETQHSEAVSPTRPFLCPVNCLRDFIGGWVLTQTLQIFIFFASGDDGLCLLGCQVSVNCYLGSRVHGVFNR